MTVKLENRDHSPISIEQIQAKAPSVLATSAHSSRSESYLYVPTTDIISHVATQGFFPVQVIAATPRDDDRKNHSRHMVRFGRVSNTPMRVGDVRLEIVSTNSHDGTSAAELGIGLWRRVCSNGLEVPVGQTGFGFKLRHSPKWKEEIEEGTYNILNEADRIVDDVERMNARELTEQEQLALAEHAMKLRWGDNLPPLDPRAMLALRRRTDSRNDAFTVLNRVQESAIQGGNWYSIPGQTRRTRPTNSIADIQRVNRGLWTFVSELTRN